MLRKAVFSDLSQDWPLRGLRLCGGGCGRSRHGRHGFHANLERPDIADTRPRPWRGGHIGPGGARRQLDLVPISDATRFHQHRVTRDLIQHDSDPRWGAPDNGALGDDANRVGTGDGCDQENRESRQRSSDVNACPPANQFTPTAVQPSRTAL